MSDRNRIWQSTGDIVSKTAAIAHADPFFCLYPEVIRRLARHFLSDLPRPFYAVKANSQPMVLSWLAGEGWQLFDVASIDEIQAVFTAVPNATCAFMNPVKQFSDIAQAWDLGVRIYALDSLDELDKICAATAGGFGSTLLVRLALSPKDAVYSMAGKFGASYEDAIYLLQRIDAMGIGAGLTFHVGSQCEAPDAYRQAMYEAAEVARAAQVNLSIVDAGGGFPAQYRGTETELIVFSQTIHKSFFVHASAYGSACTLQTEPGRALVAAGGSALVRVELRRSQQLFVNDGVHGLLSELRWMPGMHPVRRIGATATDVQSELMAYSLAGPSCDSGDIMKGPYYLPIDMKAGDWIEIGFLGAYSVELVTAFNGLGKFRTELVEGVPPWASSASI